MEVRPKVRRNRANGVLAHPRQPNDRPLVLTVVPCVLLSYATAMAYERPSHQPFWRSTCIIGLVRRGPQTALLTAGPDGVNQVALTEKYVRMSEPAAPPIEPSSSPEQTIQGLSLRKKIVLPWPST